MTSATWGAVLPVQVWLGFDAASDQVPGTGSGAHERWSEDLEALKEAGVKAVRIGVDWSRLVPAAGRVHGGWVEWYRTVGTTARQHGLDVWWCLQERAVPAWFADEGGFGDQRLTGRWWPRWVEVAADQLGDLAAGWVPLDDPSGLARRVGGDDPARTSEALGAIVHGWRDAWRILRGPAPVATSLRVGVVRPADHTVPAQQAARESDHLMWRLWLQAWRHGVLALPGRGGDHVDDLEGSLDVLGLWVHGGDAPTPTAAEDLIMAVLERAGEQGPERPIDLTLRPGHPDPERSGEIAGAAHRAIDAAADHGVAVTRRWLAPGIAAPGAPDGLLDAQRRPSPIAEALGQDRPR